MNFSFSRRWHHPALGLLVVGMALALIWLRPSQEQLADLLLFVRKLPFPWFILAVGLLPIAGIPVTALYLAAGAVYAPVFGYPVTLGGLALGLALNFSLTYAVARVFHQPVDRLLHRFGRSVPKFKGMSPWKVILLVRITPGAPLMIQNLLLGFARVPFPRYLGISLLTELLIAGGYLTAGQGFATGRWGFLALGAAAIGGVLLTASLLKERMKAKDAPPSRSNLS